MTAINRRKRKSSDRLEESRTSVVGAARTIAARMSDRAARAICFRIVAAIQWKDARTAQQLFDVLIDGHHLPDVQGNNVAFLAEVMQATCKGIALREAAERNTTQA